MWVPWKGPQGDNDEPKKDKWIFASYIKVTSYPFLHSNLLHVVVLVLLF